MGIEIQMNLLLNMSHQLGRVGAEQTLVSRRTGSKLLHVQLSQDARRLLNPIITEHQHTPENNCTFLAQRHHCAPRRPNGRNDRIGVGDHRPPAIAQTLFDRK